MNRATPPMINENTRNGGLTMRISGLKLAAVLLLAAGPVFAAEKPEPPKKQKWSFEEPLGTFDRAALQRGFQVYKEVCSSCHSLKFVTFGMLAEKGGPGFSEPEAKALAAGYKKEIPDETGQPKEVPRTLADTFPAPYPNEEAARASNGGALPPDLSLMPKARKEGPDYIFSLVSGFEDAPAGVTMRAGMHYNPYFPGHQIAMSPPLSQDRVTYADGTPATVPQMAHDVVTFLSWAAEPKMEERKHIGLNVMIYLVLLSILLYWTKRRVWRDVH